jgi:type IV fimbrial biogenesis protein FimT
MLVRRRQHGVTLIELMVGLAIVAILLTAGIPSFGQWIQNTQTRTAAESILNGLQTARTEAARRNADVRFSFTDATGLVAWNVGCVTVTAVCPATIQSRAAGDAAANARVGVSVEMGQYNTALASGAGLPAGVTFNGMGGLPIVNIGTDIARIDVTNAASVSARRLIIVIGTGGSIRMCDPQLSLGTNPQGCS